MAARRRILTAIILFLVLVGIVFPWAAGLSYPLHYWPYILKGAQDNSLDPYLVAALIKVESNFNPRAVSPRGARGLMQLMPDTARWIASKTGLPFTPEQLFQPQYNITLGCWYLNDLQREFGPNLELVLAAYNAGRGNVRQWMAKNQGRLTVETIIEFQETKDFVLKVRREYGRYQFLYTRLIPRLARLGLPVPKPG